MLKQTDWNTRLGKEELIDLRALSWNTGFDSWQCPQELVSCTQTFQDCFGYSFWIDIETWRLKTSSRLAVKGKGRGSQVTKELLHKTKFTSSWVKAEIGSNDNYHYTQRGLRFIEKIAMITWRWSTGKLETTSILDQNSEEQIAE